MRVGAWTIRPRWAALVALLALAACSPAYGQTSAPSRLLSLGVTVGSNGSPVAIPASVSASFIPGTGLLKEPDVTTGAARPTSASVAADWRWVQATTIPGRPPLSPLLSRALLDLRDLTGSNGAFFAAPAASWRYVWPRDSAFAAAALASVGHQADAYRILSFLRGIAPANGRWQARYLADGSGRAPDSRGVEMDGGAWVTWATWLWARMSSQDPDTTSQLTRLWPMVAASAAALAQSIGANGLPLPSEDYWEVPTRSTTVEIAATASLGLRAASSIARQLSMTKDAAAWLAASRVVQKATTKRFGGTDYQRYAGSGGADAAIVFLGPPFAPASPAVTRATTSTYQALQLPNGGVRPGTDWMDGRAWTPETAFFGLSAAATGNVQRQQAVAHWLGAHTTDLGEIPEQVRADGRPASVAPLGWTSALEVLTAREHAQPLPIP